MRWKTMKHDDWRHSFAWLPVNTGELTLWWEHYAWRYYQSGGGTNIRFEFGTYGLNKDDIHSIGARHLTET